MGILWLFGTKGDFGENWGGGIRGILGKNRGGNEGFYGYTEGKRGFSGKEVFCKDWGGNWDVLYG